jgi:hypothetical protein
MEERSFITQVRSHPHEKQLSCLDAVTPLYTFLTYQSPMHTCSQRKFSPIVVLSTPPIKAQPVPDPVLYLDRHSVE